MFGNVFKLPRGLAIVRRARSGPPEGSAPLLRRRRSPLGGGTSERRRLRREAGRSAISRRSAPGSAASCWVDWIAASPVSSVHLLCSICFKLSVDLKCVVPQIVIVLNLKW